MPTIDVAKQWVDDKAAARICGIARSTWRALVASGRAPAGVKVGRCRRWSAEDVARWMQAGAPSAREWERQEGGKR